jgi:hypothetical protein
MLMQQSQHYHDEEDKEDDIVTISDHVVSLI